MHPFTCKTSNSKTLVNLQAAVVIICETTFLLAFTYPIINVKRLAGSMKLSVKMVG